MITNLKCFHAVYFGFTRVKVDMENSLAELVNLCRVNFPTSYNKLPEAFLQDLPELSAMQWTIQSTGLRNTRGQICRRRVHKNRPTHKLVPMREKMHLKRTEEIKMRLYLNNFTDSVIVFAAFSNVLIKGTCIHLILNYL